MEEVMPDMRELPYPVTGEVSFALKHRYYIASNAWNCKQTLL